MRGADPGRRRPPLWGLAGAAAIAAAAFLLVVVLVWIDPGAETADTPTGDDGSPQADLVRYENAGLGVALAHPEGWVVSATGVQSEGVVLSLLSPDGSVIVDVSRAFSPPIPPGVDALTHLNGYAQAVFDMEVLDWPGFEVVSREVIELEGGVPAVLARYTIGGGSSLTGDILVVIAAGSRAPAEATPFGDEAFVVRAIGPAELYTPNAAQARAVLTGFAFVDGGGGGAP